MVKRLRTGSPRPFRYLQYPYISKFAISHQIGLVKQTENQETTQTLEGALLKRGAIFYKLTYSKITTARIVKASSTINFSYVLIEGASFRTRLGNRGIHTLSLNNGIHFDLGGHKVELISKRWQPQKAVSISKHSFVQNSDRIY